MNKFILYCNIKENLNKCQGFSRFYLILLNFKTFLANFSRLDLF